MDMLQFSCYLVPDIDMPRIPCVSSSKKQDSEGTDADMEWIKRQIIRGFMKEDTFVIKKAFQTYGQIEVKRYNATVVWQGAPVDAEHRVITVSYVEWR